MVVERLNNLRGGRDTRRDNFEFLDGRRRGIHDVRGGVVWGGVRGRCGEVCVEVWVLGWMDGLMNMKHK